MLLKAQTGTPFWPCRRPPPPARFSSVRAPAQANGDKGSIAVDAELLRTQLDRFHAEAEVTRSKANSARSRLMRLSETAEKLKQRAAIKIRDGKEAEARELLIQKKKLMQALENSRSRIQVLDELSAKITEVVSLKEAQLIETVAVNPASCTGDSGHPIHFVYPKGGVNKDTNKTNFFDQSGLESVGKDLLEPEKSKADQTVLSQEPIFEEDPSVGSSNAIDEIRIPSSNLSCDKLMKLVDEQLKDAEEGMITVLRRLIMESESEQVSTDVQQILEILKDVHSIRERFLAELEAVGTQWQYLNEFLKTPTGEDCKKQSSTRRMNSTSFVL